MFFGELPSVRALPCTGVLSCVITLPSVAWYIAKNAKIGSLLFATEWPLICEFPRLVLVHC